MFGSGLRIKLGLIGIHRVFLDLVGFGFLAAFLVYDPNGSSEAMRTGIILVAAVFVSLLAHELGHAFTVQWLTGQETAVIISFGGVTVYRGAASHGRQIAISLAGPFAGFLLGGLGYALSLALVHVHGTFPWAFPTHGSAGLQFLSYLILVSFIWGVFNLIPAVPMDGGQALRATLHKVVPPGAPVDEIVRWFSLAVGAAAAAYFFWALKDGIDAILVLVYIVPPNLPRRP